MEGNIEKFVPPSGDWFQIHGMYLGEDKGTDYVMSLVIGWAVNGSFVEGIISGGYGHEEELGNSYTYVHGDDLSPTGKSWKEIFNDSSPFCSASNWSVKDITEMVKETSEKDSANACAGIS
jgi:hypothetical protein